MNFFRSEEHLRRWEDYQEKRKEGIISLDSLMQLFSLPFFKNRNTPDYVSRMSQLMADAMDELDNLSDAGGYWRLSGFEKAAFSVALKLGIL